MKIMAPFVIALAIGACADLPVTGDGVVELKVERPASTTLRQGSTIRLKATAHGMDGQPVDIEIRWATPDTTVDVDPLTGDVTAVAGSGNGRVQASVGTLRSDVITFILQPAEEPPTDPEPGPEPDPEPEPGS